MLNEDGADVTVVVVPREKYSGTRVTIDRLLSMSSPPFELVVVDDVRAPRRLRRWLRQRSSLDRFDYVTIAHPAGVNEARMEGFTRARTPYVLFIDNDVWLHDGAIDALLACATETNATAVAPAYCVGPRDADAVHHVCGEAHIEHVGGRPRLVETARFDGRLSEIRHELRRTSCEAIELHCALVRADDLRAVGGLDARLGSSMDCVDLAFRAQRQNGVWFEPAAVVTYDDASPSLTDLRLYLDRWSDAQIESDIARLVEEWELDPADPQFNLHRRWLKQRRWKSTRRVRDLMRKLVGPRAVIATKRVVDKVAARVVRTGTR